MRLRDDDSVLHPKRIHLAGRPEITVARVGPSLTLYTEQGRYWASEGAAGWLARFLELVDVRTLKYFTTSTLERWVEVATTDHQAILSQLSSRSIHGQLRPFFEFRWVDDPGAARVGFIYREIDTDVLPRTGYVQFHFPPEQSSDDLLALAMELADAAPFACGIGGWTARYNPATAPTAFREIRVWTRRYAGLDVQFPDRFSYVARDGLPTTSWLALVGPVLEARLAAAAPVPPAEVMVTRFARGTVVRAGDRPTLGDGHRMEHPAAMHAAAGYLAPILVPELPAFPGPHWDSTAIADWRARFASSLFWA